jgi:hypothetical protein
VERRWRSTPAAGRSGGRNLKPGTHDIAARYIPAAGSAFAQRQRRPAARRGRTDDAVTAEGLAGPSDGEALAARVARAEDIAHHVHSIHPAIGVARPGNSPSSSSVPRAGHARRPAAPQGRAVPREEAGRALPALRLDGATFVKELKAGDPDVAKIEWTAPGQPEGCGTEVRGERQAHATNPGDIFIRAAAPKWRNSACGAQLPGHRPRRQDVERTARRPASTRARCRRPGSAGRDAHAGGRRAPSSAARTPGSFDNSPLQTFADNDGWYDDVSDGPVTAVVTLTAEKPPVDPAWVIVGPPSSRPPSSPS